MTDKPLRLPVRSPGEVVPGEMDGFDEWELAAMAGEYDQGDPHTWPDELKAVARANWTGGPDAFEAWLASHPKAKPAARSFRAAGGSPGQPPLAT